jgi:hypothetical protein
LQYFNDTLSTECTDPISVLIPNSSASHNVTITTPGDGFYSRRIPSLSIIDDGINDGFCRGLLALAIKEIQNSRLEINDLTTRLDQTTTKLDGALIKIDALTAEVELLKKPSG